MIFLLDLIVEFMPPSLRRRVVEHERIREWLESLEWRP